jgi:hypothetical protein
MKIYSDFPLARGRQILLDLVALVVVIVAIWAGVIVHGAILVLADIGKHVEKAGSGFQSTMSDAAKAVSGIPLVGKGVRAPFDSASGAGKTLAEAGQNEQSAVAIAAVVLGIIVALVPIYFVVRYLVVRRIRFAAAATAATRAARASGGIELLAFRALATADPKRVLKLDPAVVGRWRSGDERITRELAGLELERSGVRLRALAAG